MQEVMNEYIVLLTQYLTQWGISPGLAGVILAVVVWLLLYLGRGLGVFRFLMRWYQRLLLLAGLVALGFWLFYIGREHQVFLDNKPMNDYRALEQVNVSINGGESVEIMARERSVKKTVGPEFELKAEIFDEDGEIVDTITRTITPKCSKDIMINLPMLAGGAEDFVLPAPR
ncbi:MAG: hypothetical protein IJG65_09670 [Synergistaceae bacterium]|nr:hypothetical protein [Synergistaceae bacterium]